MNILIIRAFVKLHEVLAMHRDLARKLEGWSAARGICGRRSGFVVCLG